MPDVSTTLFLFWWRKLIPKLFIKKMEKNSNLLLCNRNGELSVEATFDFKVAFLRGMMKENLIVLKRVQKKSLPFFVLFVCHC